MIWIQSDLQGFTFFIRRGRIPVFRQKGAIWRGILAFL